MRAITNPFRDLAPEDPGTRARLRTEGGGLARLASIPGSVDSPHNRQRQPITVLELNDSFMRVTTIKPSQRGHCISPPVIDFTDLLIVELTAWRELRSSGPQIPFFFTGLSQLKERSALLAVC